MPKPLVVFDCVTFLQGLIKESGPAVTCLEQFREGSFSIAISKDILEELQDVLSRSSLRKTFPLLTEAKAKRLIELLLSEAISSHTFQDDLNIRAIPTMSPA